MRNIVCFSIWLTPHQHLDTCMVLSLDLQNINHMKWIKSHSTEKQRSTVSKLNNICCLSVCWCSELMSTHLWWKRIKTTGKTFFTLKKSTHYSPLLPSSNAAAATILLTCTWLMCGLGVMSVLAWVGRKYDASESQWRVSHRRTSPEVYLPKKVELNISSWFFSTDLEA